MKGSKGYILIESVVALGILCVIVFGYLDLSVKLQINQESQMQQLADYRSLYMASRRLRITGEVGDDNVQGSAENCWVEKGTAKNGKE